MGFREGEKETDRRRETLCCHYKWNAPRCSRAGPSLHHSPTSFISSGRHWEHSTTHLPPVNIAWRLNYTHTHTHTLTQSQRNFLQRWSRELTSNLWGIHSSEWVLCLLLYVFLWPLRPLLYPSGHICSPRATMSSCQEVEMTTDHQAWKSIFSFNHLIKRFYIALLILICLQIYYNCAFIK